MHNHGCHNKPRPTRATTYLAQDGWIDLGAESSNPTRVPRYVSIHHVMTTACQYTLHSPNDPRCAGCQHQAQNAAAHV